MSRAIAATKRLQATARHEAGHAIAAWRQCLNFKHATIKPKADSLGQVLYESAKWFRPDIDWNDRIRLHLERHIIADFAGQRAEAKFRGRHPRYGMAADNKNAVDLAFRRCGSQETTEAYLRYCFLASQDLVEANWKAIEAVAAALLERVTLTREDIIGAIMPGSATLKARLEPALARKPKGA